MKKIKIVKVIGLFLSLVLIMGLIIGCEKKPIDPPKYTIEAYAGVGGIISPSGKIEVVSGDSLNFTLSPDPGFKTDSITVNGVSSPLTSNTYDLSNVTNDYKIEVTFKKTLSWYVMQVTWKLDSTYIHELNGTWSYYPIWGVAGEMQKTIKFLPNGYTAVTFNGISNLSDGFWRIDETKTPPEIHFAGNAAALKGAIYVLEGDLKNRLVLARYNWPYIEDSTKKSDYKYIYTPLK